MSELTKENTTEKVRFTFQKEERLCSKKIIEKLFAEGKSFYSHPFKILFLKTPLKTDFPVQVAFAVSKKSFKRAVDRNLIKRKMRESYRLNKFMLYKKLTENQLAVFIIFTGKTIPDSKETATGIIKGINRLIKEIEPELK